jgi:DNA polymerase-1
MSNNIYENFEFNQPKITSEEINEQIKPVLRKMEVVGIKIDCKSLQNLDLKLSAELKEIEAKIHQLAGHDFNVSSPIQLADILFNELKLPTEDLKKTKTGISTAAHELNKIADSHPIIALILKQREIAKLLSTYLKPLPTLVDENDRLHTTYGLDTTTGRLSSSEPNLQNIPIKGEYGPEIRSAFIAGEGMKLITADYSQIELRVVACIAQDKSMIEAFEKGEDIHARTASEIFGISQDNVTKAQRRIAKAVNFGIVYGQTPYGLSQALGIEVEKAGEYIRNYFEIHKGIKDYINKMIDLAHEQGYVETLFGSKRYLPNINNRIRFIAESEERMAINTPVQGTAAEILKLAMIELDQKIEQIPNSKFQIPNKNQNAKCPNDQMNEKCKMNNGKYSRMLLTVHDELVVEVPADQAKEVAKIVKEAMENVVKICVPIEVNIGIGNNWGEAK